MVSKLETMCSMRKAPMGTIPVSECSLRQKKEWPSPARRGCTPRSGGLAGGAGGAAVAMADSLISLGVLHESDFSSRLIIPPCLRQRQEINGFSCDYRYICAIIRFP